MVQPQRGSLLDDSAGLTGTERKPSPRLKGSAGGHGGLVKPIVSNLFPDYNAIVAKTELKPIDDPSIAKVMDVSLFICLFWNV